jgi:hypothetical protein
MPHDLIDAGVTEMVGVRGGPTANRNVVGVMNECRYLAEVTRVHYVDDVLGLLVHLAGTRAALDRRHVSPDRELAAFVAEHAGW